MRCPNCMSTLSTAWIAACKSPVWPTMSGLAKLIIATSKVPVESAAHTCVPTSWQDISGCKSYVATDWGTCMDYKRWCKVRKWYAAGLKTGSESSAWCTTKELSVNARRHLWKGASRYSVHFITSCTVCVQCSGLDLWLYWCPFSCRDAFLQWPQVFTCSHSIVSTAESGVE